MWHLDVMDVLITLCLVFAGVSLIVGGIVAGYHAGKHMFDKKD